MAAVLVDTLVVYQRAGYLFDPKDGGIGLTRLDLTSVSGFNNNFTAACTDPVTDDLFFVFSPDTLASWSTSSTLLEYIWKSKIYQLPYSAVMEAAQVKGKTFGSGLTFRTYSNESSYYSKNITAEGEFVLPNPTFGTRDFQMEVQGTAVVTTLESSENMDELE